jgi:exonuclease SbcC
MEPRAVAQRQTRLAKTSSRATASGAGQEQYAAQDTVAEPGDAAQLRLLREELAKLKASVADGESDLAAGQKAELDARKFASLTAGLLVRKGEAQPSTIEPPPEISPAPALHPQPSPADAHLLAAAAAQAALNLQQSREAWQAEQDALLANSEGRAHARLVEARERWRQESDAALAEAEKAWQAGEAARLATAKAQWQEQSTTALAEARAEAEMAGERWQREAAAALSEAEKVWQAGEAARLAAAKAQWQEQSATALAEARAEAEMAGEIWQQESAAALLHAQTIWQAGEAARLAAAKAQWQEQSATALAEARAEAETARDQGKEIEFHRLREECTTMRATLADRETELTRMGLAAEQAHDIWQQESAAALSQAQVAWRAEEVARLAAAEAQWRNQSASDLAEATQRFERAEAALKEAHAKPQTHHDRSDHAEIIRLREERAALQAALAQRDIALDQMRAAVEPSREIRAPKTPMVITQARMRNRAGELNTQRKAQPLRHLVRDSLVAACLAVSAIVFYPRIGALIPGMGNGVGSAAPVGSPAPAAPHIADQRMAVLIHGANVRAGPSGTAEVISALQAGAKVATVEQRGNWALVQIDGESDNAKPRQGWVYRSFLKDSDGTDPGLPTAKPN